MSENFKSKKILLINVFWSVYQEGTLSPIWINILTFDLFGFLYFILFNTLHNTYVIPKSLCRSIFSSRRKLYSAKRKTK